jgi:hypothetical protein
VTKQIFDSPVRRRAKYRSGMGAAGSKPLGTQCLPVDVALSKDESCIADDLQHTRLV